MKLPEIENLPTLEECDAEIRRLETELAQARQIRRGVELMRHALYGEELSTPGSAPARPSNGVKFTVRALMERFVQLHKTFSWSDVDAYVRKHIPTALETNIRSQLSCMKRQGLVSNPERGVWVSQCFKESEVSNAA